MRWVFFLNQAYRSQNSTSYTQSKFVSVVALCHSPSLFPPFLHPSLKSLLVTHVITSSIRFDLKSFFCETFPLVPHELAANRPRAKHWLQKPPRQVKGTAEKGPDRLADSHVPSHWQAIPNSFLKNLKKLHSSCPTDSRMYLLLVCSLYFHVRTYTFKFTWGKLPKRQILTISQTDGTSRVLRY